jgi:hypothetical protein
MVNPVGGGNSGCQGSSDTQGGGDANGLDELWKKLLSGAQLSEEEKAKLKKALMDKGYSAQDAESMINNQGQSPNGQTPQDIQ